MTMHVNRLLPDIRFENGTFRHEYEPDSGEQKLAVAIDAISGINSAAVKRYEVHVVSAPLFAWKDIQESIQNAVFDYFNERLSEVPYEPETMG
jgi:hypothetical protein